MRTLAWFSCGAASAVATKLCPEAIPVYCDTGAEHPDNKRFMADCERWFDRPVTVLKNEKYRDTWHVWEKERYLDGPSGAHCTGALKMAPRLAFQRADDVHVIGYTTDPTDVNRANRLRATYPEMKFRMPLIERGLYKASCLALLQSAGIVLPAMYLLGFHNNNCIPCVKAQSPGYWALVRKHFPEKFDRLNALSRKLNMGLVKIDGRRRFLDELPNDWSTTEPIAPACDFLCQIAEQDL
jgi:hypothetical protein